MKILLPDQLRRRAIEPVAAFGYFADASGAASVVAMTALLTAWARRTGASPPDWKMASAVLVPLSVFLWRRGPLDDAPPLAWTGSALGAALLATAFAGVADLAGPVPGRPTSFIEATLSSNLGFKLWIASRLLPGIFVFSIGALVRASLLRSREER
jgi:hypothetical protein